MGRKRTSKVIPSWQIILPDGKVAVAGSGSNNKKNRSWKRQGDKKT